MAHKRIKPWDETQSAKAAARRAHFANGGTPATWRGRPARFIDRRKAAFKQACRGRVREDCLA